MFSIPSHFTVWKTCRQVLIFSFSWRYLSTNFNSKFAHLSRRDRHGLCPFRSELVGRWPRRRRRRCCSSWPDAPRCSLATHHPTVLFVFFDLRARAALTLASWRLRRWLAAGWPIPPVRASSSAPRRCEPACCELAGRPRDPPAEYMPAYRPLRLCMEPLPAHIGLTCPPTTNHAGSD